MFCDSHCHVFKEYYEDIDSVINNSLEKGINRIIVAADNYKSSNEVLELINNYDNVFGCIGLHPENVLEEFNFDIFNNLSDKIIAIGEIGLDYHYGKDNKEKQIEIFKRQLDIAKRLNKPVVIHSRDATEDMINILKNYNLKGIIHSFSGSLETANIFLKMGYKLGINGVVTFKNCNLKDVLIKLSPNDLVLETDSPYLTPEPFRGHQNDPSHIYEIALFVSNLYGISMEELANITNKNIKEIFDI